MLPIVSEVVENKLANSDLLYSFDPKAELGLSFFESLSRLPADVISAVFVDLQAQVFPPSHLFHNYSNRSISDYKVVSIILRQP